MMQHAPQTIARIIDAAPSRGDAIDMLFKHYSALTDSALRDQFMLALAAELMVQRAMKRAA